MTTRHLGKPIDRLTPLGRVIRLLGAARFYHNGDAIFLVWRWWHPVAWFLAALFFTLSAIIEGVPRTCRQREDIGFRVNPYFRRHPEELDWIGREDWRRPS